MTLRLLKKLPITRAKLRLEMLDNNCRRFGGNLLKNLGRVALASGICIASLLGSDAACGQQQQTFSPPVHIPPAANSNRDRMARMAAERASQRDSRLANQQAVLRSQQKMGRVVSSVRRQLATSQPPRQQGPDLQQRIAGMFGQTRQHRQPTQADSQRNRSARANLTRPQMPTPSVAEQKVSAAQVKPQSLAFENRISGMPTPQPLAKRKRSVLNRADRVPLRGERMEYVEPVQFENEQLQQPEVEHATPMMIPAFKQQAIQGENVELEFEGNIEPPIERQAMLDEFGRPISVLDQQPQLTAPPASQEFSPKQRSRQTLRSPDRHLNSNRLRRARPMQSSSFQNRLRQDNQDFGGQDQERLPNPDRTDSIQELDDDLNRLDDLDQGLDDGLGDRFKELSCEELRAELLGESIRTIALDISPPRVGEPDQGAISRTWTDQYGRVLGTGTMVGLSRGYVIIDGAEGRQKISFGRLGDADLAAVAEYWSIPAQCTLGPQPFNQRFWTPQTMTWKASGLCHKPLYFENIQLERYGHSAGPISQPFYSAIHFFGSLVALPYQTAIHPPNECRYALGYYRPGNCAPWLRDPLPISLQGIRRQALFSTGLAFIP